MTLVLTPESLMCSVVFFGRKKKPKSKRWFVSQVFSGKGDDIVLQLVHMNSSLQNITTSVILNTKHVEDGSCDPETGLFKWRDRKRRVNVQMPVKKEFAFAE